MSDIASPILAVMDNEAHAFICFCGIMKRLEGNFRPDGQLMSVKFQHLKLLLQYSDPEFYSYLVSKGADDLFFCYRWLLLELKREFVFDDALRMLEVTWSSLPPDPPETEVELLGPQQEANETMSTKVVEYCSGDDKEHKEKQRRRHMLRPSREEPELTRNLVAEEKNGHDTGTGKGRERGECEIPQESTIRSDLQGRRCERQASFGEFKYYTARNEDSFDSEDAEHPQDSGTSELETNISRCQSTVDSEDDPGERTPLIKNCDNGLLPASSPSLFPSGLPVWKTGSSAPHTSVLHSPDSPPKSATPPTANGSEALSQTVPKGLASSVQAIGSAAVPTVKTSVTSPSHTQSRSLLSSPILSFGGGTSLSGSRLSSNNLPSPGNKSPSTTANTPSSLKPEATSIKPCSLPPPQEFGKGNPFMLFLCLSILLEHRDHIIKNSLDYNELAMHFDRLVRRHNLNRVLQRAKALFADYLQSEVWDSEEGDEVSSDSPTTTTADQQSPSSKISARPIYSPLASPPSSPNSTYNLTTTIPSPLSQVSLSPAS